MKNLVTLLVLAALGYFAYTRHIDQVKLAAEKAAEEAHRSTTPAKKPRPERLQAVGLSRVVEPLYNDLFSPLKAEDPCDLVPPLQITKERVLDVQTHASAEKRPVYTHAIAVLDAMIALAGERTVALEAVLRSKKTKGTLDGPNTTRTSTTFFAQSALKRWDEERKRQKVHVDQLFAQLRTAEREWNKAAGKDAVVERYDLPASTSVLVSVDEEEFSSPLEKGAYGQSRTYPWRKLYYDRYGYPQTYPQPTR